MTPATPAAPTRDGHPRTVLLTGATGFVGRAVLPALVAAGWQVRCFTRQAKRAAAQFPLLDWVEGNVEDQPSVAREVVLGLTQDLLARDDAFWRAIGHPTLISVFEAARRAIAAERDEVPALGVWGLVERLRQGAAHPVTS